MTDLPDIFAPDPPAVAEAATPYATAPPPAETIAPFFADTERGIRLYQGDALDFLRRARSGIFDMIFADPPYFLSNNGVTCQNGQMVSVNKGMWDHAATFEAIHEFNMDWLRECRRLLKPNGTIWVTGTNHNIYSVGFAMQTLEYKILNDIAWYKVNPPPNLACRYFTHATETILWARKSAMASAPDSSRLWWSASAMQYNVIRKGSKGIERAPMSIGVTTHPVLRRPFPFQTTEFCTRRSNLNQVLEDHDVAFVEPDTCCAVRRSSAAVRVRAGGPYVWPGRKFR